jgi:2-polyprenyl-6-hydroxyphenyl methylase/3-demethylubiquinone-9 3-methyltransferase
MTDELFDHAVEVLAATRLKPIARCKICGGEAHPFDIVDFNKSCNETNQYPLGLGAVPVVYRACSSCNFIFTDFFDTFSSEQWQRFVYNDEYVKVDPEYVDIRPRIIARKLISLLSGQKKKIVGLDYGGGNGKTAALLRENGFNFDNCDPYGHNDVQTERRGYNFCSSFEVFEHTTDPVASLKDMLDKASPDRLAIIISTGLSDQFVSRQARLSWWYASPRNGHVSLFSRNSMQILADKFGLQYLTVRRKGSSHLMTRGISDRDARAFLLRGKVEFVTRTIFKMWDGDLA